MILTLILIVVLALTLFFIVENNTKKDRLRDKENQQRFQTKPEQHKSKFDRKL